MFFRVLGPVDVWAHEQSHTVGQAKAQTLLGILLLEVGRVVSASTLAERLWDQEPPRRAHDTLQVYISRLRRSLREAGDRVGMITSTPGGYRLATERHQIDAHRLSQLVVSARSAAGELDLQRARGLLLQSEALWRGEPFEGLGGQWIEAARSELVQRRRSALLARIGLDLRIETNRDDAISELTAFVRSGRIDQNAIEMLMTALAGAGRQDEALEVYRTARTRMREELGVEPRRELAALHQAVLRGEAPESKQDDTRPARIGPLAPRTLDRGPAHLVGRDELLHNLMATIAQDLQHPQAIALYAIDGMPGIGKTAFALHAAHQLLPTCPDGALQISFRTHDPRQNPLDSRTALVMLLEALGTAPEELARAASHDELAALWRRRSHGLRLLMVFDDVRDADQITPLIPASGGSVVLITSRQRLALLPEARQLTLSPLNDLASTRLLANIADRGFPGQSRELRRFAARCAGLPLAITVAAAHLRAHPTWSLTDLIERLDSPPPGPPDTISAPVHRAFEVSYRTLSPRHRTLLRLAAHQPTPDLGLHAAAALLDSAPAATDLLLELLVEQHLIEEVSRHRYRLHDLLRTFAAHLPSEESDDADTGAASERVTAFYLSAAARAEHTLRPTRRLPAALPEHLLALGLELAEPADAAAWLDAESANLLALTAQTDTPGGRYAGMLTAILAPYLDRRGLWPQAVEILSRAHRALAPTKHQHPDTNFAQLLVHLTAAHVRTGALQDATASASAALAAWRALDDERGQADALLELGRIHWRSRRLDEAIAAYQESELLYQRLQLPHGRVLADYHRAISLFEDNRFGDAFTTAQRALTTAENAEDPALTCEVLINLAELYQRTDHDAQAAHYLRRARQEGHGRSDPQWLAALALNTGILQHRASDNEAATTSLHTALELYQRLADRDYQLQALTALTTATAESDLEAAHTYLRQAEQLLAEPADRAEQARIETAAADLLAKQNRETDAIAHLHTAIDLADEADAQIEEARARRALSIILTDRGEKIAAHRQHRRAQSLYRRLGHTNTHVNTTR